MRGLIEDIRLVHKLHALIEHLILLLLVHQSTLEELGLLVAGCNLDLLKLLLKL